MCPKCHSSAYELVFDEINGDIYILLQCEECGYSEHIEEKGSF